MSREHPFKAGDKIVARCGYAYLGITPGATYEVLRVATYAAPWGWPTHTVIILDDHNHKRERPASEFTLAAGGRSVVEQSYAERVAEAALSAPYGGQGLEQHVDPYTETANRALAARVRQLEEALRPFYFKPGDFVGKTPEGAAVPDLLALALDGDETIELVWPMINGIGWASYISIRDLRRVREVMTHA